MARILLIRFSALGDVAMTVPVVHSLALQYPQHEFTILSNYKFKPLFQGLPSNVIFYGVELHGKHKGLWGLNKIYGELNKIKFDCIADWHDVLRSKFLRYRFRMGNVPAAFIDKGRIGKEMLIRQHYKVLKNQKSSFRRYADVLEKLGYPVQLNFSSIYGDGKGDFSKILPLTGLKEQGMKWIGIAPFSKHKGKVYPLAMQEKVVEHFSKRSDIRMFLFGGGEKEKKLLDVWAGKYVNVISTTGKLSMDTELTLMSYLDVMLSMDSANMHLASLVNVQVVSVWGATHPYAGFMGWQQLPVNTVQLDMPCRPCSVYGQRPCRRKDYACLCNIEPEQIIRKIEGLLS